jgi:phage gpG-like protein
MASFADVAARIASMAAAMKDTQADVLDEMATRIQERAKAKIGHYQDEAGPFNGWSQLKKSTQQDRSRHGYGANDPLLRTGDLRDSIKKAIYGSFAVVGSDSMIAVYQELGTHGPGVDPATGYHVPPRPFLGPAAYESREWVGEVVTEWVRKCLAA